MKPNKQPKNKAGRITKAWAVCFNGKPIELKERMGEDTPYVIAIYSSKRRAEKEIRNLDADEEIIPCEIKLLS